MTPPAAACKQGGRSALPFGLALLLLLLLTLSAIWAQEPPRPAALNAPKGDFSAARARSTLARVLGPGVSHFVGSAANKAVRERLETELEALGLRPRLLEGASCGQWAICADVQNVIVELPSRRPGRAIALAAHYDSVPAGPGASDAGAAVASVLEVARALLASGGPEHPVMLIFTDGEEMGLLGALQLRAEAKLLRNVQLVINLEARGVEGPSLMFETSAPNLELVRAFGRSVERPVSSSAFYAVYKALPNDTDLTVFRQAGVPGLNFAFIGGAAHYHTPRDDLSHLSSASLQHEGEQALALVREFDRNGVRPSYDDAIFFDLFGSRLIVFAVSTGKLWAALVLAVGLLLLGWGLARRLFTASGLAAGVATWGLSAVLSLLAALIFDSVLRRAGTLDDAWPASSFVIALGLHAAALAALFGAAALVGRALETCAAFAAGLTGSLLLLAALLVFLPEALFAALFPSVAYLLAGLVLLKWRSARLVALAPLLVSTLLWAPIDRLAFDALGVAAPVLGVVLGWVLVVPLLPYIAPFSRSGRIWGSALFGAVTLSLLVAALVIPARSKQAPGRVSLAHQADVDGAEARWLSDARHLPAELRAAVPFAPNQGDDFPWFGASLIAPYAAPAPRIPSAAPSLQVLRETPLANGVRELELRLVAGHAAPLALTLALPNGSVRWCAVDGEPVTPIAVGERQLVTRVSPRATGVQLVLRTDRPAPLEARLVEHVQGLPASARQLEVIRDQRAGASQTGDVTIVSRSVQF